MSDSRRKGARRPSRRYRLYKSWILILGLLIFAIGVICILTSLELPYWVPEDRTEVFSDITMVIGQILVSVSVTGLLFEQFGYADYTTRRICDALVRSEVLDILSQKHKEELKDRLFEDIYLGRTPEPDPLRLVDQLDEDIDRLLADYYYEEFFSSCDISIVETLDGQKLFRKEIHRNLTARSIQTGRSCSLERLYQVRISGLEDGTKDRDGNLMEAVKFTKLVIQGDTLTRGTEDDIKDFYLKRSPLPDDSSPYAHIYEVVLAPKWKTFLGELRVEMTYETYVPCDDPYYSVTVDRPCKSFFCSFNFRENTHDLHVKGYGFMATGDALRKHQVKTPAGVTVRYRSWILPGDGAVAFFSPKQG